MSHADTAVLKSTTQPRLTKPSGNNVKSLSILRQNSRGDDVISLQALLNVRLSPSPKLTIDGMFGPLTGAAVVQYQKSQGIATDGVVGRVTWSRLLTAHKPVLQPAAVSSPHNSPAAAPAPSRTQVAPPGKRDVVSMPLKERFIEVLRLVGTTKLTGEAKKEFAAFMTPTNLSIMAGTFVFVAILHGFGVGEALDVILAAIAVIFMGLKAFDAGREIGKCIMITISAKSEADLDAAAAHLATAIMDIGVVAFMLLLHRMSQGKGGAKEEPSGKPPPKEPTGQPRGEISEMGTKPKAGTREVTQSQFREGDANYRGKAAAESYKGHGHGRHGSQTTMAEQTRRVQTGEAPDGNVAPTSKSTKFSSHMKEAEAVERAKAANPGAGKPKLRADGTPNRDVKIVDDGPEGYGDGVEVQRGPDGKPLPGRPVQPTGPQPNAKVIFEYDPKSDSWQPLTQYPTDEPVTP